MRKSLAFSVYRVMRVSLKIAGVHVWDTHADGPGLTMWRIPGKRYPKYTIVIGFYRSRKKRMFALAHELGHIMRVVKKGNQVSLVLRKKPCGEIQANETAIRFLAAYNPKWAVEFAEFYDWANRHSSRRKRMTDGKKEEKGSSRDHGPWEIADVDAARSIRVSKQVRDSRSPRQRVKDVGFDEGGSKVRR